MRINDRPRGVVARNTGNTFRGFVVSSSPTVVPVLTEKKERGKKRRLGGKGCEN